MIVSLIRFFFLLSLLIGSRTIRTEEAILISLAALESKLEPVQRAKEFNLTHLIPQSEDTGAKQFTENFSKQKHKKSKTRDIEQNDSGNEMEIDKMEKTIPIQTADDDLERFD